MEIKREASDKHKGILLQKLRAIKLALNTMLEQPLTQLHIAIESDGDVFIYSDTRKLLEENKNYDSKKFSFASHQILNTLVYFIDYWLRDNVQKSTNVLFSFYSTNDIAKENNTEKIKNAGIVLPDSPILELLQNNDFSYEYLLSSCKLLLLNEYKEQYKGENHNYEKIKALTDEEWKQFFSQIRWNFGMPANAELKKEITDVIGEYAAAKKIDIQGKEDFVQAMLRMRLEDNQETEDKTQRYLTDDAIQLVFYKIAHQPIEPNLYRYLDFDYSDLQKKVIEFCEQFLKDKYFSVNHKTKLPLLLQRTVKQHNSEIKIYAEHLNETKQGRLPKMDIIVGNLNDLVTDVKPTFLFGEIGSGKSSIAAQFALQQNSKDQVCLFIPANNIKGKITQDYKSLFNCIDHFIKHNIYIADAVLNFDFLIKNRSCIVVFDGLDELSLFEVKYLVRHLEKLSREQTDVTILATGRPLELRSIVHFNDWNCLTTIDLSDTEVVELLKNEAIAAGITGDAIDRDAQKRAAFLKGRKDLSVLARTPLTVCVLRDFLDEDTRAETLGSLMHKVLLKRLEWDEADLKVNYGAFFSAFPAAFQREGIIAQVAEKIANSKSNSIGEVQLSQLISDSIHVTSNKYQVVAEATLFYKNLFLQPNDGSYSFYSQPLLEAAHAIKIATDLLKENYKIEIDNHNWRVMAYAIAINREKGYIEKIVSSVSKVLTELLFSEDNTPYAAVIVSESQHEGLAKHFISEIGKLDFRPLRAWSDGNSFWSQPNSYSVNAIAQVIYLAGETGFEWFFNEYINPIHFIHVSIETLGVSILETIFNTKNFVLNDLERSKLASVIDYHMAVGTSACGSLIPILALVFPERFAIKERCLLLADLLNNDLLYSKAKELLEGEINAGNRAFVMNALETVCANRESKSHEASLLWLNNNEVNETINEAVLKSAIRSAAKEHDFLFETLSKKMGKDHFESYLRYNTLNNTDLANSAAILLYSKFGERNFYMVARPLLNKGTWENFKNEAFLKILDDSLLVNSSNTIHELTTYTPLRNKREHIPELYLLYFNKALCELNEVRKNQFLFTISRMPEYSVLSRYPDLRDSYKKLVMQKPQYRDALLSVQYHPDARLRFNAASVLLACFPETAKAELETVIRSSHKRLNDHHEWLRFCMKLHYGKEVLEYIRELLPDLTPLSRHYALCVLYHQGVSLSDIEKDELLEGLTGEGSSFDYDNTLSDICTLKRILEEPEFYNKLRDLLDSYDLEKAQKAASALLAFHYSKLSKYDLGKIYVLEVEHWERYLYDFDKTKKALFSDNEFVRGFEEMSMKLTTKNDGKECLLSIYKKVIVDKENYWLDLVKRIIQGGIGFEHDKLEWLYRWLMVLRKREPSLANQAGKAVKELMDYPVLREQCDFNSIFPPLVLIVSEFDKITDDVIKETVCTYNCHDEVACSLLARLNYIPANYQKSLSEKNYYTVFAKNNTNIIHRKSLNEIEKILLDGNGIPNNLSDYIISILFFGTLSPKDLERIQAQGKIAAFLASIVLFCRNGTTDFSIVLKAITEVGYIFYRNALNQSFRQALFIIKETQLNSKEAVIQYSKQLVEQIEKSKKEISNNVVDDFKELFNLEVDFDADLLPVLLDELFNRPYLLNLDLMASIFNFVAYRVKGEDREKVSKEVEMRIQSCYNYVPKNGMSDEIVPLMWTLSLLSFFLESGANDIAIHGFLKGLESVFVVRAEHPYYQDNGTKAEIKGRDLLIYSQTIYGKIDPKIFSKAIDMGIKDGSPEIKAVCRMLKGFAG